MRRSARRVTGPSIECSRPRTSVDFTNFDGTSRTTRSVVRSFQEGVLRNSWIPSYDRLVSVICSLLLYLLHGHRPNFILEDVALPLLCLFSHSIGVGGSLIRSLLSDTSELAGLALCCPSCKWSEVEQIHLHLDQVCTRASCCFCSRRLSEPVC